MRSVIHRLVTLLAASLLVAVAASGCSKHHGRKGGATPAYVGAADATPQREHSLIKNVDFNDGTSLPWTLSFSDPAKGFAAVENGAYCLHVDNKGVNKWDAQVRHREMVIQKGHTYSLTFKIWGDQKTRASVKVGMVGPPFREYWVHVIPIDTQPTTITDKFTMNYDDDPTAEFTFHYGGAMALAREPFVICIDDVILSDTQFVPPPKEQAVVVPKLAVNQVGYFPHGSKIAAYANTATSPLKWELLDGGQVVSSGNTVPFGLDSASGENVHIIDFSSYMRPGKGLSLRVGNDVSPPIEIGNELYHRLKYDALHYYYHNRSGIELKMPYAEDKKWERPAGHLSSDRAVACAPEAGCNYKLDVSGGWYDAGDHGKYVVNGGVTVWTLLNLYERTKFLGTSLGDFADGKLNIPENRNRMPDLLDEVRWELEWEMRMQVPDGQPRAGMVHHKIHDRSWTALGIRPDEAEKKMMRFLRPVSTAATLNFAANAAQCGRIWKGIDDAFAGKCLMAAEKAWQAAKANPQVMAAPNDNSGGGPYDDSEITDDFYWAAAELWTTTQRDEFRNFVTASPWHNKFPMYAGNSTASFDWARTDALGKISMATVSNGVEGNTQNQMKLQIVEAADTYLKLISETGYSVPFKGSPDGKYPWGSNSFILNNTVIMGLAYDFTKQKKYFDGVIDAMGYIFGRNPLGQSYVTGYGSKPLENPHHRFWSYQVDKRFPTAPPGCVSGGPNSGLQDPYVQAAGLKGCAPEKCFVDNIEAWSANEITINWNAPLVWIASFLDERGPKLSAAPSPSAAAKPATAKGKAAGVAPAAPAKGQVKGKKK